MKLFVAVTDKSWYRTLRKNSFDEVNFWQPNNQNVFRAVEPGDLFLFKLHAPINSIVGFAVFARQVKLPLSLTWESFGQKNGVNSYEEFCQSILRYRNGKQREIDPIISSLILTSPQFWNENDWIASPRSWASSIVQGKTYRDGDQDFDYLLGSVKYRITPCLSTGEDRFGKPILVQPRLGQASFRMIVTSAYHSRCAISGEKTLPVLEAAHIKPYHLDGPHEVPNGILLRQDFHTLYDKGFITITNDFHVEVSKRIKELYGNGKAYYEYHGKPVFNLPESRLDKPSRDFLSWHNENVYIDSRSRLP